MSLHPLERFLGVPADADPFTLLGIDPERAEPLVVDDALRRRLGEVFRHPDGRSEDAEDVKAALREAAEQIKHELVDQQQEDFDEPELALAGARGDNRGASHSPGGRMPEWMSRAVRSSNRLRPAGPVPFKLTAFDRMVLAALIACGGWNARSRAQLVALAQTYGISVQGLLRVIEGLGDYARAGGPHIGVSDIAGRPNTGAPPLQALGAAAPPPVGPALLDRLAEHLGEELKHGGPWPTIKLAIVFGVVTIVAGIIALRVTLHRDERPPAPAPAVQGSSAGSTTTRAASSSPSSAVANSGTGGPRIARFPKPPTFLGNGMPAEATNAVDHAPALPGQIDELSRKITVADGNPSDAVYHQWQAEIDSMAIAWVLADASTRAAVEKAIFAALRAAAETPAVSDRLLKTLAPPASVQTPLDLWRGAWMAGTLARIASTSDLPPVVVERARSQLEIALSQNIRGSMTFEAAGEAWLAQRIGQLVQSLAFDPNAYDAWELWLSAERALGQGERHDAAIMSALRGVLETNDDLSVPGPPVNVVARLMDLALQSASAVARQRMLDLFDDEQIAPRDLWVLTSLLSASDRARWFPDRLIVPDDADMSHRWRVRDDLTKVWPAPATSASQPEQSAGRPKIDEAEAQHWASLAAALLPAKPGEDQATLMQQLINASRMIEAATALVVGVPEEARRVMKQIEEGDSGAAAKPAAGKKAAAQPVKPREGQAIGPDGAWAAQYNQLPKNTEAKSESLRSLRTSAGTDLGPVDAALLVREAYRGSPTEVRLVAQAVLMQQFAAGPIVGMQLLDQFPDAPTTEPTSEMIQSVTGQLLPGVRTSAWASEARLALVQHALNLKDQSGAPLDGLIDPLISSYTNRLAVAKRDASVISTPSSPQEAATLLLRGLMAQAEFAAPVEPTPADLPNIQRRLNTRLSLADGPIQGFIAQQLTILDVTTYIVVAEQPALRARALLIMREHSAARSRMNAALEQALDIERATLEIWRLRLGFDPQQAGDSAESKGGGK